MFSIKKKVHTDDAFTGRTLISQQTSANGPTPRTTKTYNKAHRVKCVGGLVMGSGAMCLSYSTY